MEKSEEEYIETIKKAGIIAESPVEGTIILKPYGCMIWEQIKKIIKAKLKELGYEDMYFPMLIPHSFFKKQEEHYKSFSREAVFCTRTGEKELKEELIIRPTSETIIYPAVKEWIKTEADLPIKINQWCSIMRWETLKPTLPLIRNNEFLWHECHSIHASRHECDEQAGIMHEFYKELLKEHLAIAFFEGKKPERRKFAGAEYTLALEGMMKNRKCIQLATSHSLGQKFSKAFSIKTKDYAWMACAGITTRLIGAVAMAHSDENGLVLPPKIAPYEVAVDNQKSHEKLKSSFRTAKMSKEEAIAKGVPVIIEKNKATRRDTMKETDIKEGVKEQIQSLLKDMQDSLLRKSEKFKEEHTYRTDNYNEFKEILLNRKGAAETGWCGKEECSKKIKKETNGSLRIINNAKENAKCVCCGKKAQHSAIFGQSY